jgi:arsenate reductase (thioredoxin)
MMHYPIRVLFLCTGNSARSQMAEGLLRSLGGKDFDVYSAGSAPKGIHPITYQVMEENGVDITSQRSKDVAEYVDHEFDYVITLCDKARQTCPDFAGDEERIHWGYPDIGDLEGSEEVYRAFKKVAAELRERIRLWMLTQRKLLRDQGIIGGQESTIAEPTA